VPARREKKVKEDWYINMKQQIVSAHAGGSENLRREAEGSESSGGKRSGGKWKEWEEVEEGTLHPGREFGSMIGSM